MDKLIIEVLQVLQISAVLQVLAVSQFRSFAVSTLHSPTKSIGSPKNRVFVRKS